VDRPRLLSRLDKAWSEFKESYTSLSDAQMMEPGVQGRWSVRDILAHVTTWEEEALTHLPLIVAGGRPPRYSTSYGGIDAFNALTTERKRHLPLSEVLRQLDEVHHRLLEYVHRTPQEFLMGETRFRRRLRLDAYGHYPKHARVIRRFSSGPLAPGADYPGTAAGSRDWSAASTDSGRSWPGRTSPRLPPQQRLPPFAVPHHA
jgi:DinB family protein